MNKNRLHNIKENRHILKCCVESILLCGRQCIALRGDVEKLEKSVNPGSFLAILTNHYPVLKAHLDNPRLKNATYISPDIQNQIIDVIGKMIIQNSILVDEVTSHNQELMPLVIRFVDRNCNIREEFVKFSSLTRLTGKAIVSVVVSDLEGLGLDICHIRGLGYNGASNMSSSRIGLQACIREKAPLAVYTHCSGHCLNLVISHSCNIPVVTNALDKVQSAFRFFHYSPKRSKILQQIVSCNIAEATKRKPLLELCKTQGIQLISTSTSVSNLWSSLLKSLVLDNTRIFCQMTLLMLPGILNQKTKPTLCYTPLQS